MSPEGARCLVLGGSGAVGQAICRTLVARGARVAFSYHRGAEAARQLAAATGAEGFALDLADPEALTPALDRQVERLGGVDAFIHAAALGSTVEPAQYDELGAIDRRGWERLMAVNVTSAFFACQHLMEPLCADGGGEVVLFGSVDGIKMVPAPVPYATTKAALRGMVQALAKALGKRGVRVNLVAPGVLEGGISRTLPDELRAQYLKHCGLKRVGRLEEVAALAAWLALENTYVTGQTLLLDGGL
jgi:NAD(P)-dependent dehydrogenase (short-subunit alcohol dehydrogenase family)